MCRVGLVSGVAVATLVAVSLPADANTGHVFTSQTCFTWSASVTLDTNVTTVHRVEVTTTIPGTTGIVDGRYDTTNNSGTQLIWSASGNAPAAGTVTLTILNPDNSVDYTESSSLQTLKDCTPSTTTTAPTTTTTMPPSTTTLPPVANGETTTTLAPTTTTVAPPPPTDTTTTTIVVSPTTVTSPPTTGAPTTSTTPIGPQGSTSPPTTTVSAVTGGLPRTGSGTAFPLLLGGGFLVTGGLLALWRRRTVWSNS
jgi:LPXTG-motif cell wall-anchored protein